MWRPNLATVVEFVVAVVVTLGAGTYRLRGQIGIRPPVFDVADGACDPRLFVGSRV